MEVADFFYSARSSPDISRGGELGVLGEVLIRTYFESQGRRAYAVREIRTRREHHVDGAVSPEHL